LKNMIQKISCLMKDLTIFIIRRKNAKISLRPVLSLCNFVGSKMTPLSIADNLKLLKCSLPESVCMVAVSKQQPVEAIMEAYHAGQRVFGENKAQELVIKRTQLPNDIEWHFIGHLQSNKVKEIAPFITLIHSIDSLSLLQEVNRQAFKNNRVIDCLLQFYIATEESKFGLEASEAMNILSCDPYKHLNNVRITGVMGMSSFTENTDLVRQEFHTLFNVFQQLRSTFFQDMPSFRYISMGMSGDYPIAIGEGSNMIRIGTTIFGDRHY